jgi:hypothetical protein
MSAPPIILQGVVKPDGTLELFEKVNLPPGPVQVTVQAVPQPAAPAEDLMTFMEKIWAGQRARGHVPRSAEEIEAEREAFRREWDEHDKELEAIHEECRRAREQQNQEPPAT